MALLEPGGGMIMTRMKPGGKSSARLWRTVAALWLTGLVAQGCRGETESTTEQAATTLPTENIINASFGCISDRTPVDRFFVGNLNGDVEATVAVSEV